MNPVAFKIGGLAVYWYGILIVVGILAGSYVAMIQARRRGQDAERVWDALLACLILGLVGARLYHVFSTNPFGTAGWPYYRQNPLAILKIWEGGLGLIGALVGGALGIVLYARLTRLPACTWLDIGAYGALLAQAIGRWGNYINQELYGPPTRLPWGIPIEANWRVPPFNNMAVYPSTTRFHPLFLYESLWCLIGFVLLWWIGQRPGEQGRFIRRMGFIRQPLDGDVFCLYTIWYAVGRFWIEFLRLDAWRVEPVAVAQICAGVAFLAALAAMVFRHRRQGALVQSGDEQEQVTP